MSSSNDSIAPRICILGYGRLAEALTERLAQACSRISVYARRPPQESANNVHFFSDVRQAVEGAQLVLAVTSDFASILDILQDIRRSTAGRSYKSQPYRRRKARLSRRR
jgi:predicted dinucleotide-binding enzyme